MTRGKIRPDPTGDIVTLIKWKKSSLQTFLDVNMKFKVDDVTKAQDLKPQLHIACHMRRVIQTYPTIYT